MKFQKKKNLKFQKNVFLLVLKVKTMILKIYFRFVFELCLNDNF